MYKKLIIVTGILLLMVSSASATDAWWNSSYQYRVPITLTGSTSGSQTNYQLMLNVSYDSNMQSDFDDLRFTDDSGNLQNAWLEDKTNDSWANIWVNFTFTPADGATQTYYAYYGNSGVSNYWNIDTTFALGDNFEGSSLDTSKWTERGTGTTEVTDSKVTVTSTADSGQKMIDSINSFGIGYAMHCYGKMHSVSGSDTINVGFGAYELDTDDVHYDTSVGWDSQGRSEVSDSMASVDMGESVLDTYAVWKVFRESASKNKYQINSGTIYEITTDIPTAPIKVTMGARNNGGYFEADWVFVRKYVANPSTYSYGIEEEYTLPAASETPIPALTPTPLAEITASNYIIQNQTLYITKPCNLQYKVTSNSFVYGGSRNINTIICDNNNTVISGWFKVSTDKEYNADYTFIINVNDTSYQSKIVTLKQTQVDNSIISKTYRRTLMIDGYEIYSYNTTVYIISIIPNPIYFYFNLEDRTIQFGDKQFNNQTLVFNQLNFDDQYNFMNNASSDTIVMRFKAINPSVKSGAELKGLTGILLNALSKIPFIGKSFKNVLYYPLFFIQTIFDFVFTFLDIIVNDWWYGLMLMEIVCIFSASRNKGYANVMEVYIDTHVKIIKFIYEWIILKTINLIITIVVTIKDMIKWW